MRERSQALFLIGERRPRTPASARENNVVQRNVGVRQAGGTPGHRQRPERNDGRGQVRTRTTRRRTLANWPPLASFPACFFRPWGWMVARDGTRGVRGSAVVPARPLEGHRAATDVPTTRESAPIRPPTPRRSPDPPPPRHIPSRTAHEASKPRPVSKSNDDAFNFWFWQLSFRFYSQPSHTSSLTVTHFSTSTARAPGHRPTHGVNPPRVRPSTWTRQTTNSTTRGADHPRRRRREKEDNRDRRLATRAAARTASDSAWRRRPDSRAGHWPTCSATTTARRGRRAARLSARRRGARRATIAAAAASGPGPAAPGRGALG